MTSAVAFADGVDACHEAASESVVGSSGKTAVASGRRLSRDPVRGYPALSDSAGLLDVPKTRHRLWRVCLGLVAAGRNLLKLFGGASFLADGPGGVLYLAELLGNAYLHPGRENSRG
jgi:hypothetical protein